MNKTTSIGPLSLGVATALALASTVRSASAAEPEPAPAAPQPMVQTVQLKAPPPPAQPSAPPAEQAAPLQPGSSDHDMWIGHIGVGWFGISNIPIADATPGGDANVPTLNAVTRTTVAAPAIGVRYWLDRIIGFDAGIGFNSSGGTQKTATPGTGGVVTTVENDKASATAFLFHGGVPLALANSKHFSFQVIPELNVGFATGTHKPPATLAPAAGPPPKVSRSGFLFDIGARVGAELYFGFIGVPQLALEGSVGLFFRMEKSEVSAGPASNKDSSTTIATTSFNNPWEIFTSTVAARYYF